MFAVMIGSQWYAAREDPSAPAGFVVVSGPYAEEHWAVSAAGIRDAASLAVESGDGD